MITTVYCLVYFKDRASEIILFHTFLMFMISDNLSMASLGMLSVGNFVKILII